MEAAFLRAVTNYSDPAEARKAYPELAEVWTTVFGAVEKAAEAAERKLRDRVADEE